MIQQGPLRLLFSFLGPKTPSPGKLCLLNIHKLWCLSALRNNVIKHALACLCGKTWLDKKTEQKVRKKYQGKCLYFELILLDISCSWLGEPGTLLSILIVAVAQSCMTPCDPMDCSMPGFLVLHQPWSLLKLMSIELMRPSNYLILYHPLLLPSIFPSIRVFSSELTLCIRKPKYWSFSFSVSSSNEYSRPISFRIDWFALLAAQGTLKSFL